MCVCAYTPCANCRIIPMQLAGILNPYNGDCLLDPVKGPSGFVEYTRFNEFVSSLSRYVII